MIGRHLSGAVKGQKQSNMSDFSSVPVPAPASAAAAPQINVVSEDGIGKGNTQEKKERKI
jgi:hypothetical protein